MERSVRVDSVLIDAAAMECATLLPLFVNVAVASREEIALLVPVRITAPKRESAERRLAPAPVRRGTVVTTVPNGFAIRIVWGMASVPLGYASVIKDSVELPVKRRTAPIAVQIMESATTRLEHVNVCLDSQKTTAPKRHAQ